MAKIKKQLEDCSYRLCPLGTGAPFCAYTALKAGTLADMRLQDFPICQPNRCVLTEDEREQEKRFSDILHRK